MSTSDIPTSHLDLLDKPIVVQLATVMADGQPQVTPVWADRHGDQVWVNTALGRQKVRNLRDRPVATICVLDPANSYRWLELRCRVVGEESGPAAWAHIEALSQAYFGRAFRSNSPDEERIIFKLRPFHVYAGG